MMECQYGNYQKNINIMKAADFNPDRIRRIATYRLNGDHFYYDDKEFILSYSGATCAVIKEAGSGNKKEIKIKY